MTQLLHVDNISVSFDGFKAINGLSFDIAGAELRAIIGPNGAGKSTLLHLLQGRLVASGGHVVCGCSVALMPQRAAIDWTFPITVSDMVNLGRNGARRRTGGPSCHDLLERVGMAEMASRRLSQLSGGQQQRVLLARALMQNSGVLLLDEPCSAIDPPTREHLLGVMRQQAESGQTLLVSSHDWGSALDSYDRVVVLDGSVLASGSPADVRSKLSDLTCMMGSHCCE